MDLTRLDKTAISIGPVDDSAERRAFWHSRTPEERLEAMEQIRELNYGAEACTARLQRVLEVVERT